MRDSISLKMIPYLCKKGAKVNYYDPTERKKSLKKLKIVNLKKILKTIAKMLI